MRPALVLLAAALAGASPAKAELDLQRAEVTHLPDGLTVVMLEDHSFPVVSVQMLYKSGSAAEKPGKTGLAHFMEHLAFRGSRNFPAGRATELIYDAGGEWHGYTAMDQTTYFATMPSKDLDLLLRIEADRMARTIIDPASIEAEKGAVITELHSYENDPASVLQDAVTRTAIQTHPYGSPMAGYVSEVRHLTSDDAQRYYAAHYSPSNAVLAIVGDFLPSRARTLVAQQFADVPARPAEKPQSTPEQPQGGARKLLLSGPVDRQYFLLAFPAPAASSPDSPAFLVLQQVLSGGSGLNVQQGDWSPTGATGGSLLFGTTSDIATWLPPTRDPFLFMVSGSIAAARPRAALEHDLAVRIAALAEKPATAERLSKARADVLRALSADVQTTEDAAHQLAFFEGIGALDILLRMPALVSSVTAADVQRVARVYLNAKSSTLGWLVPGTLPNPRPGAGMPKAAADRAGSPPVTGPAGEPRLRTLSGGLPAIVQHNPLSSGVTVELVLAGPSGGGSHPPDLPGLDAVVLSGTADELDGLLAQSFAAARRRFTDVEHPSEDPATRMQQLIVEQEHVHSRSGASPLVAIVSGNVRPEVAFAALERKLGHVTAGKLPAVTEMPNPTQPRLVRAAIAKSRSQGAIGYVVEGPRAGTRQALAWQLLLYVLTHDYSGRLGRSAITGKGIVYHMYSGFRTDGRRTWATVWTGVDPDKADAMEAELRSELRGLASAPPSSLELEAARQHLLGRDVTAAQSNEELTAKLGRQFLETGTLLSHEQLRSRLAAVTLADVQGAAEAFAAGTIIRVDVHSLP